MIAGYLVWIRNKYQPPASPKIEEQITVIPTPVSTQSASPSASPKGKEATGSMKQKTSTGSSTKK